MFVTWDDDWDDEDDDWCIDCKEDDPWECACCMFNPANIDNPDYNPFDI